MCLPIEDVFFPVLYPSDKIMIPLLTILLCLRNFHGARRVPFIEFPRLSFSDMPVLESEAKCFGLMMTRPIHWTTRQDRFLEATIDYFFICLFFNSFPIVGACLPCVSNNVFYSIVRSDDCVALCIFVRRLQIH